MTWFPSLRKILNWDKQRKVKAERKFEVSESVHGNWFYHIIEKDKGHKSLCGKDTMSSGVKLENWGKKVSHIPEKYCSECKTLYDAEYQKISVKDE